MNLFKRGLIGLMFTIALLILPVKVMADEPKVGDSMIDEFGIEFVYIAPGKFMMGSPEGEFGRYPDEVQHEVEIKKGFWLAKYETTFELYDHFSKKSGNSKARDEHWGRGNRPVIHVKWQDAQMYADWLTKKSRKKGYKYRLPTEAEWEYAARAGTTTAFSWGDNAADFPDYAWNGTNADKKTHPVGQKKPNPWGLYDMHGNVWEWTGSYYKQEWDGSELKYSETKSNKDRSVRGGAWYRFPKDMRSGDRRVFHPRYRLPYIGFRLVREN